MNQTFSNFDSLEVDNEDLISLFLLDPEITEFDNFQFNPTSSNYLGASVELKTEDQQRNTVQTSDNGNFQNTLKRKERSSDESERGNKKDSSSKSGNKKRQKGEEKDIEAKVNALRAENADLQAHLMNVTQRTTEVQKQRTAMEMVMHSILKEIGDKEDADQTELAKTVKQYTDIYADYGKCRQREVRPYTTFTLHSYTLSLELPH